MTSVNRSHGERLILRPEHQGRSQAELARRAGDDPACRGHGADTARSGTRGPCPGSRGDRAAGPGLVSGLSAPATKDR